MIHARAIRPSSVVRERDTGAATTAVGASRVACLATSSSVALRWLDYVAVKLGDGFFVSVDLSSFGPERFSSRELSRLEFGARLLDLAEDRRLPVLERCKFIAIFADMIDEFFQVRVVSLEDKVAAGVRDAVGGRRAPAPAARRHP